MKRRSNFLADLARLPLLTGAQALREHFDNNLPKMHRVLRAREAEGFITFSIQLVRPRIVDGPLAILKPGDKLPSSHHLAYLAGRRWSEFLTPTLTIKGTAKLYAMYGGEHRAIVAGHLSHEVALVDVLLSKRHSPDFEWTLIHARPGLGAMPDAVVADTAIELIGRYSGAMVSAKLGISATCNLELW
jgi:hypothetical protein